MGFGCITRWRMALERDGMGGGRKHTVGWHPDGSWVAPKSPRLQESRALEDGGRRCRLSRASWNCLSQFRIGPGRLQRTTKQPPQYWVTRGPSGHAVLLSCRSCPFIEASVYSFANAVAKALTFAFSQAETTTEPEACSRAQEHLWCSR